MGFLKTLTSEKDLNGKVFHIIRQLAGENNFQDIEEFFQFYKISASVENDRLIILQFFHKDKKWEEIARFNLKTKKFERCMDKKEYQDKIKEENLYIVDSVENEIKKTSTIIISLIALILGAVIGIIILSTLN